MTTDSPSPSKFNVVIRDGRGIVIGDDNVVYQYFLDERYRPLTENLISFDVLIGERTQDFVGRGFLDDALSQFMRNNDRGYFALVAEPGIGKTSWAAHVVRKYKALHHFNIASLGIVRPETALQNLCAQIIARFKLDRPYLPPTAGRDGSLLDGLLQQAGDRLGKNESLVIVIDALDEVRMPAEQRRSNVLFLPGALPKGVYVVVTQRPDPLQLSTEPGSPLKTFTLSAELDANMLDVRAFLRAQAHERGLINPLKSERFVDALATASQGNFMYLAYALQDLADQPIEGLDLSQLPQGLRGYYDRFWGEMAEAKGEGRTAWTDFYKPVIGVLAVVREPVSAAWMGWVLDLDEEEVTDFALARWRKFLQRSPVGADVLWRPYHRSFSDFLQEKLHGGRRVHRQLADRYLHSWGGFEGDLTGSQDTKLQALDGGYGLRHLATHLALAGKMEQLRQLLMTFNWLQAKLEATSVQALLQDYVHLPKDPVVRVVHEAIKRSAQVLRQDPTQLASQLLGRLQARPDPEIQTLLRQAASWRAAPWLRPLTPSLIPPGDPLLLTLIGNEGTVRSIAVTPDGRWGLTVENSSEARVIRFWDFITGTELHAVVGMVERGGYNPVGLTADGHWALVAIAGDILVWNVATGERKCLLQGHDERISALVVAEDGRQAVSGGVDGLLVVWDLGQWRQKTSLSVAPESVHELAITPDGCHAVALTESKIVLLDLVQEQEIAELPLESGSFLGHARTPVALSPDGKCVYFGSPLHLWQVGSQTAQALPFDQSSGTAMAILPTADLALVKASDHETLEVWDIAQGIRRRVLPGQRSPLATVVWTADGRTVVASLSDHSLKVWALEYTAASVAVAIPGDGVDLTPDGRWAISSDEGSVQSVWDFDAGEKVSSLADQDAVARTMQDVWRERAARLASADSMIQARKQERDANALSPGIGLDDPVVPPNQEGDGRTGYLFIPAFRPKTIIAASNGVRAISHLPSPGKTSESEETGPPVKGYALSLWDLTTPDYEPVVLTGHSSPITAVAMTPDGCRAVSGCIGRTVRVWDLESGCELRTLRGHAGIVWDVRITLDGHYAVSASGDRSIRIWDVDSGHCVATYIGDVTMRHCAVSDDVVRIAARDVLGRIHLLHLQASP